MPVILPQVLKNLFRKPFTVKYPYVRVEPPEGYRGKPIIDKERCTGCEICVKTCPAGAVSVSKETMKASVWFVRCIFCGVCAETCPRRAITLTKEFELALFDKALARSP